MKQLSVLEQVYKLIINSVGNHRFQKAIQIASMNLGEGKSSIYHQITSDVYTSVIGSIAVKLQNSRKWLSVNDTKLTALAESSIIEVLGLSQTSQKEVSNG